MNQINLCPNSSNFRPVFPRLLICAEFVSVSRRSRACCMRRHLILLDFITLHIWQRVQFEKPLILHTLGTNSLLGSNTLLSILFSYTLSLCVWLVFGFQSHFMLEIFQHVSMYCVSQLQYECETLKTVHVKRKWNALDAGRESLETRITLSLCSSLPETKFHTHTNNRYSESCVYYNLHVSDRRQEDKLLWTEW